ncbi:MAG TPA: hypothetical protein VKZ89_10620 [Thermobifida alba]|nr:hypothetical protein [Thermobifida alba]
MGSPSAGEVRDLLRRARRLLGDARELVAEVRAALEPLRERQARAELATMPVSRPRDVTSGALRIAALQEAGYTTVLHVLRATPYDLRQVPGVGPQTRTQARRAAERIEDVTRRTRIVHIDVDDRDAETTRLLVALHRLVAVGPDLPRARRTAGTVVNRLDELIPGARPLSGRLRRLVSGRRRRARAELAELSAPEVSDRAAAEGFLPDDLTERVGVPPRPSTCAATSRM